MIHRLADCMNANIPESTNVWQFCVILPKCTIGENCNICSHCYIENEVIIGDNVTIKSGVQIWDGITLDDNVFIGANVSFTNDMFPRSKNQKWQQLPCHVCKGATIGAGSVILPGITIGSHAMVGAGSVVTNNIPPNTLWYGNPARLHGYITTDDEILDLNFCDKDGNLHSKEEFNCSVNRK